jgi:TonB family protein
MKPRILLSIVALIAVTISCTHNMEKKTEDNFIAPVVKSQPRLMYPKFAQTNGLIGNAKVLICVTNTGAVEKSLIRKSSGYDVLDNAAINYCNQLVFSPAIKNGEPVEAKIIWDIKFNISDFKWDANAFLFKMGRLFRNVATSKSDSEKRIYQKEILQKDSEFINNMRDGLAMNFTLKKILLPEICAEWDGVWDSWPLSFLLYHDFLKRYKDYDSISEVKTKLFSALEFDIRYIKNTFNYSEDSQKEIKLVLDKIKSFINKNYPEYYSSLNI